MAFSYLCLRMIRCATDEKGGTFLVGSLTSTDLAKVITKPTTPQTPIDRMKDIDIANAATLLPIEEVAAKLEPAPEALYRFGRYKAKVETPPNRRPDGKLILVSAMTPTPPGEGKTTVSIGLADAMNRVGAKTALALREPSMGPVFGMKGGATGGGRAQVVPMEDINLHFTGDFAAIERANNLLSALIDNNIQHRRRNLDIDPRTVQWKRVMDMNDRSLRHIVTGLGGRGSGIPREGGFDITAASEIMAILCLAEDTEDLKNRFSRIFVGRKRDGSPVYAGDLNAHGAMAALMKDAIKPNLVQTLEGNPAFIHGGPFANIAQGTNSVIATKMAMSHAPFTVTEAGFATDLGAEKFIDIKCRSAQIFPSVFVVVATIRALKYHGGTLLEHTGDPDPAAVKKGLDNLGKHLENGQAFGLNPVVAINRFVTDSDEEIDVVRDYCRESGVDAFAVDYWKDGGSGGLELAEAVVSRARASEPQPQFAYETDRPIPEKIEAVARRMYGADRVDLSAQAKLDLALIDRLGMNHAPVCLAKTQNSLSDNPKLLGRPQGFAVEVDRVEIARGAGFVIPILGKMMRMPGLPVTPAAESIDIDERGNISGLF